MSTLTPRTRRRVRRREAQRSYETLTIEGGLLGPEWLDKIAALAAPQQSEAEYGVLRGVGLRDEIGSYWRLGQAHFAGLLARRGAADPRELGARAVPALLREVFGFQSLQPVPPVGLGERSYPIGHAALGGRVPVVIAPVGFGLEVSAALFADGARRRSAFGVAQEYLNAAEGALWGVCTDGLRLRILRDNASLTRPAWIEADLLRIFQEERYADFAALWLLVHESRFGRPEAPVAECALEAWRDAGREEGTRARESLRQGVAEALLALGNGFLSHRDNGPLRTALSSGALSDRAYFSQLLRLVYRLIFLLTVEERGLLHPPRTPRAVQELYAEGYGLRRLRERAARRTAYDRYEDLWAATRIVLRGLTGGEPRLGLPALGGLFGRGQCAALEAAQIENRALLLALFHLSWLSDAGGLARVNWRDMGPEELGSVYESLLELVPVVSVEGRTFRFASGGEARGNVRKTSGSYYTPDSLVQVLLDSALEPVIQDRVATSRERPVEALLGLSIVDPACGSGHFLLAAARRLAGHVARLQTSGTPSAVEYRSALRQVVGRCIYGVDLNPLAVELCKVALWMEAVEPGLPLGFLDAHIQCGNALLGTTKELMAEGVPDEAWEPIEGDDKKVASALKKRNKKERAGEQGQLAVWAPAAREPAEVARAVAELEAAPDGDAAALAAKEERWAAIQASGPFQRQRFVADAWCAAFVWPKPGMQDPVVDAAPTAGLWRDIREGKAPPSLTVKTVEMLAGQYHFFHWQLAFPTIFEQGGFDVVLGNPPWERVTLKEKEWFANRDPHIADATKNADRQERIQALRNSNSSLWNDFQQAKRNASGEKSLLRSSGAYPLCGTGDVNTFAVFAELGRRLCLRRTGLVLPSGIATADTTQLFIADLVKKSNLYSLYDFDNRGGIFFSAVQGNVRFCLISFGRGPQSHSLGFHLAAQLRDTSELKNPDRTYYLTADDVKKINPNTYTLPLFTSSRDMAICQSIYHQSRCLDETGSLHEGRWSVSMQRMLHMGDDSELFKNERQLADMNMIFFPPNWLEDSEIRFIPLMEAKLCHQYDHRAATFEGIPWDDRFGTHPATRELTLGEHNNPHATPLPRYWVPRTEISNRIPGRAYLLAFRDSVSAIADSRSLVASIVPPNGAGDTLKFIFPTDAREMTFLCAWLNSFATDYLFRLKASGAHASFFLLRQLPIPSHDVLSETQAWSSPVAVGDFVLRRVLELTYTAWDLQPFALDVGYDGPPFRWDPERRILLRAELDAAFFHLYGLSRDDTAYILDTFPIVKKNDEKAHGEYRTRRVILEIYDAMAAAAQRGVPYPTRLSPPPADFSVAHPPRPPAAPRSAP